MRSLPLALLMLLALAPASGQVMIAAQPVEVVAARVLDLLNTARAEGRRCGREAFAPTAPLATAAPLEAAARAHARDMATQEYFAHRSKDGREPRDRVRAAGYAARLSGENIAFGPESAEEVARGWLASPGHCANIMDARFRHTGIGVASGRKAGHIYWVQTFGAPGGG